MLSILPVGKPVPLLPLPGDAPLLLGIVGIESVIVPVPPPLGIVIVLVVVISPLSATQLALLTVKFDASTATRTEQCAVCESVHRVVALFVRHCSVHRSNAS